MIELLRPLTKLLSQDRHNQDATTNKDSLLHPPIEFASTDLFDNVLKLT